MPLRDAVGVGRGQAPQHQLAREARAAKLGTRAALSLQIILPALVPLRCGPASPAFSPALPHVRARSCTEWPGGYLHEPVEGLNKKLAKQAGTKPRPRAPRRLLYTAALRGKCRVAPYKPVKASPKQFAPAFHAI